MDLEGGSNLCKQLLLRENYFRRDSWYYQASIYRERLLLAKSLYQRNLSGHWGCVNALEFSNGGEYLASGGDDKRVLIWNMEKSVSNMGSPIAMRGEHASNIFCLGFDNSNATVFSGGNDEVLLKHDFETGKTLNYFVHLSPIYGLSVDKTSNNLVSTATEDGDLLVYDMRTPETEPLVLARFGLPFNAVEFHPLNGNYLISATSTRGALLWDMRNYDEPVIQYKYLTEYPSCMGARFNASGKNILTLHRRLPPILYNTNSKEPVCTFYHADYFNSCTMKSCSFAGPDDELILSGSDDFNLYVWRLSDVDLNSTSQWVDSADMVLYGHRSIVNQVRYNRQRCLIASSGVEKVIKLWSPFKQKDWSGDMYTKPPTAPKTRELYTHNSMSEISQEFNNRNTEEDPHMLAFFDSLVQRELEDWETDSSNFSVESRSAYPGGVSANESDVSGAANPNDTSANDSSRHSDSSLQAYPNRISYLISKKSRALLLLAIKGSTSTRGRIPHRVRTNSPVQPFNITQPSMTSCLTTSATASHRNRLYSSPTRMLCWLESFEMENRNNNIEERATTSAAALSRAQPVASTVTRGSYHLTMLDTSTESTDSLSENDDVLDINNRNSTHPTHNGGTKPFVEEQQMRPRKRKFSHKKRRTNAALYAKRSRTEDDTEDDEEDEIDEDEDDELNHDDDDDDENEVILSQTTNNTNSDNDDDEQVPHNANLTSNESNSDDDDVADDTETQNGHEESSRSNSSCTLDEYTDSEHDDVHSDDDDDIDTNDSDEIELASKNGDISNSSSSDEDNDELEDSMHIQIDEPPSTSTCNGTKGHKHLETNNNNGETNNNMSYSNNNNINMNNTNGNNSMCLTSHRTNNRSSTNECANQINKTQLGRSSLARK